MSTRLPFAIFGVQVQDEVAGNQVSGLLKKLSYTGIKRKSDQRVLPKP